MFILPLASYGLPVNTSISDESKKILDDFFKKELKSFLYFKELKEYITYKMLSEDCCHKEKANIKDEIKTLLEYFCFLFHSDLKDDYDNVFAIHIDSNTGRKTPFTCTVDEVEKNQDIKFIAPNYYEIAQYLMRYIDLFKFTVMMKVTRQAKKAIQEIKQSITINDNYNFDIAFSFLKHNLTKLDLMNFVKIIILSDDYFNEKYLYKIRSSILKSTHMPRNCVVSFGRDQLKKDVISLFFADSKLVYFAIDYAISNDFLDDDGEDVEKTKDIIFILVYMRFIINMCMLVYSYKPIMAIKNTKVDDFYKLEDNKININVFLAKIYHRIDARLYDYASNVMTPAEQLCYISRKFCDEICIHEISAFNRDYINHVSSFKHQIDQTNKPEKYTKDVKKMAEYIINEWGNGSTKSHSDQIRDLKNNSKFKKILSKSGVAESLRNYLIAFANENCEYKKFIRGEKEYYSFQRTLKESE